MTRGIRNDLIGKRFNRLTVLDLAYIDKHKKAYWKCVCDCGNFVIARGAGLKCNDNQSCGCYNRELLSREPTGVPAFNKIFYAYKKNANRKGLTFDLTEDYFKKLINKNCYYCGNEPNNISRSRKNIYIYNGIDRIDNNKGYTIENSIPCCLWCNYAKRERSVEDFEKWIEKLYNYSIKEKGDLI